MQQHRHAAECNLEAAHATVMRLRAALERLTRAYVNLLEIGRDRILMHGGTCDPVDVMAAGDPALRDARAALAGGAEPKHAPHCSSIPDASGPAQQCDCGAEPKYPHADEPVMWFDRDRETRAESPAKPQATLGTARHFCLACTRAFGCLPGECTAEPASERRPTCRSCGQFVDSRGKCRIPKHNDDA